MSKKTIIIIVALVTSIVIYLKFFKESPTEEFSFEEPKQTATTLTKKPNKVLNKQNVPTKTTSLNKLEKQEKLFLWEDGNYEIPVLEYLEELRSEIEKGNASAIYHMTVLQRKCSGIPETEEKLNQRILKINNLKVKENYVKEFDFCAGFPRDELSNQGIKNNILTAARLGNTSAKIEFGAYAFQDFDTENFIENAELIVELKKETVQHIFDAKSAGENVALLYLGMTYEDGQLIERDYIEAYAYYYAYGETKPSSSGPLLDMIEPNLTEDEINLAILRGQIYARCCN